MNKIVVSRQPIIAIHDIGLLQKPVVYLPSGDNATCVKVDSVVNSAQLPFSRCMHRVNIIDTCIIAFDLGSRQR